MCTCVGLYKHQPVRNRGDIRLVHWSVTTTTTTVVALLHSKSTCRAMPATWKTNCALTFRNMFIIEGRGGMIWHCMGIFYLLRQWMDSPRHTCKKAIPWTYYAIGCFGTRWVIDISILLSWKTLTHISWWISIEAKSYIIRSTAYLRCRENSFIIIRNFNIYVILRTIFKLWNYFIKSKAN